MLLRVLDLPGRWRIWAICDADGDAPALAILETTGPGDPHEVSRRQMLAYLGHFAQLSSPPRNTTVMHQIDDEYQIYEIIKGDLRLACFYDEGATVILSHGFIKERPEDAPRGDHPSEKSGGNVLRGEEEREPPVCQGGWLDDENCRKDAPRSGSSR